MSDFAGIRNDNAGIGTLLVTALAAKVGSTVSALVNDTTVTVQVARDLTVERGDVLVVVRVGAQWFAVCRVFEEPTEVPQGNETGPPPTPETVSGMLVISPVETRSYRNGTWRSDNTSVYHGQWDAGNHTGAVFYGAGPASLAGATVTAATVQVRRVSGGIFAAQPTTMRLMTDATKPAGAPTLSSSTAGPSIAVNATDNAFSVPAAWVQAMVDGTAGGIAFFDADGSPYVRFAGLGDWSPAFTMTISWTR